MQLALQQVLAPQVPIWSMPSVPTYINHVCHMCCLQIDLRFACPEQGNLSVVVAPVLRFADVGYNAGESSCVDHHDSK
jgi:hypothetical protein